jgi:sulfoxide reductase heme-binding subunit YedZ
LKPPTPQQLILWLLLVLPAAVIAARYATETVGYGETLHASGVWSVRLLIVTLAVSPLRRAFPRAAWTMWLARRRRDFGVATFGYAMFHLAVYLERKAELPILIVREGLEPGMAVGWIAFLALAALAITSNDAAVSGLGRGWKPLHRLIYPAAALTAAHWLMTAFELRDGAIHAAILASLMAARIALRRRRPNATAG